MSNTADKEKERQTKYKSLEGKHTDIERDMQESSNEEHGYESSKERDTQESSGEKNDNESFGENQEHNHTSFVTPGSSSSYRTTMWKDYFAYAGNYAMNGFMLGFALGGVTGYLKARNNQQDFPRAFSSVLPNSSGNSSSAASATVAPESLEQPLKLTRRHVTLGHVFQNGFRFAFNGFLFCTVFTSTDFLLRRYLSHGDARGQPWWHKSVSGAATGMTFGSFAQFYLSTGAKPRLELIGYGSAVGVAMGTLIAAMLKMMDYLEKRVRRQGEEEIEFVKKNFDAYEYEKKMTDFMANEKIRLDIVNQLKIQITEEKLLLQKQEQQEQGQQEQEQQEGQQEQEQQQLEQTMSKKQ